MPSGRKIAWLKRRLSVMSSREIAFRGARAVRLEAERLANRAGWRPRANGEPSPGPRLFPEIDARLVAAAGAEADELDRYCAGTLRMFGRDWNVGESPAWNRDPETGVEVGLAFGKLIDYRDARTFGDCKTLWELGRFTMAVPLALGFAATGRERYLHKLGADIDGWIEQCPFGRGPHWVSSLEAALRLIAWGLAHEILRAADRERGLFSISRRPVDLADSIYQHCWFIRSYLSEHSSANNHLIGELTGLLFGSAVFPFEGRSAAWRRYAIGRLGEEALRQNHADGVNKEQAVYYHLWVLEYLLLAQGVARHFEPKLPESVGALTGRMIAFVLALLEPHRLEPPQIGDSDDGRAVHLSANPASNVYRWLADFAADDPVDARSLFYRQLLGERHRAIREHASGAFAAGAFAGGEGGRDGAAGAAQTLVFPEGGYVVFRSPCCHVVFDVGPLGYGAIAAHGHADCLSLNVAFDGIWWLCDPGTYAYHTLPLWRDFFRSTRAHNTVAVDGLDQSEMGGAFLWLRKARAGQVATGVDGDGWRWAENGHDGFARLGVTHVRRVAIDPHGTRIRVRDSLVGRGEHDVLVGFQLDPRIDAVLDPSTRLLTASFGTARMRLRFDSGFSAAVRRGSESPPAGWYSEHLGVKRPAPYLELTGRFTVPVTFVTEISFDDEAPDASPAR